MKETKEISPYLDLRLGDCVELMREFPDGHFDLAIVDPPYGIDAANYKRGGIKHGKAAAPSKSYGAKDWDLKAPDNAYFNELLRVSKNQIIWGANHFLGWCSPAWVVWDKMTGGNGYADCELAWSSFKSAVRQFRFQWAGMLQGDMANKEKRIHPTQKPVALYKWLLSNYAKPGQKILDTHLGSGSHAIACHYAGVYLTACEIDNDYFTASLERIEAETRQASLFPTDIIEPASQELLPIFG